MRLARQRERAVVAEQDEALLGGLARPFMWLLLIGTALGMIALISTLIATALGTFMAMALVRYGFRGRGATNLLVFLPMSTPEIVLGASLLVALVLLDLALQHYALTIARKLARRCFHSLRKLGPAVLEPVT